MSDTTKEKTKYDPYRHRYSDGTFSGLYRHPDAVGLEHSGTARVVNYAGLIREKHKGSLS